MNEHSDEIMRELTVEEMEIIAGGEWQEGDDTAVDGATRLPPIRFLPEGMTNEILRDMMKLNNKLYREGSLPRTRGIELYNYANAHGVKMDERSAYAFALVRGVPRNRPEL